MNILRRIFNRLPKAFPEKTDLEKNINDMYGILLGIQLKIDRQFEEESQALKRVEQWRETSLRQQKRMDALESKISQLEGKCELLETLQTKK